MRRLQGPRWRLERKPVHGFDVHILKRPVDTQVKKAVSPATWPGPAGYSSDRVLSGRAGVEKINTASWCLEVLHKLCLLPSTFIMKYSILEWDRVSNETQLIKHCCTRGTQDVRDKHKAASELISPVSVWEELGS